MNLFHRSILSLLLLSALSLGLVRSTFPPGARPILGPIGRRDAVLPQVDEERSSDAKSTASVGTRNAPVDGKDGLPHSGPFVEDQAEGDKAAAATLTPEELEAGQTPARQSKDGVMNDPDRTAPTDGTRGTEGGVSEKSKEKQSQDENTPDPPKEAPPLPHSEEERMNRLSDPNMKEPGEADPSEPDDVPLFDESNRLMPSMDDPSSRLEDGVIQPLHSLLLSLTMILFSEIGDKTFIVAALMAMRHPRLIVFSAAFTAMIVMTVLSAVLGHVLPTLVPKSVTSLCAAALFLVFGVKMGLEARGMSSDDGVGEEMREVEMELEEKENLQRGSSRWRSSITPGALESAREIPTSRPSTTRLPSPPASPSSSIDSQNESSPRQSCLTTALVGLSNLGSLLLSPAWVQTFIMTFLGEWGDRSQIATIAMAAGQDYWWVVGGALGGHFICTGAAVLGGAAVAGKVSMKVVTMAGGVAFLVFGGIYLIEAIY